MQPPRGVITVAELDRRLRRVVEGASFADWVGGEVRGVRRAASGHTYFSLRDLREDAVIDCVMYRSTSLRSGRHLVEGAHVELLGKATVWAPRGRLQFLADAARPVGRGALLEALERLRMQLFEEGLFAPERKRPLPSDPRVIGVVTSAHGAAWHDIRVVSLRRGAVRLVLAPAAVQGEGAPASIVAALDLVERYPGLDAVIIGRGGGSLEDLMAFNDERVVRRVARCRVPTISAVGHEIDVGLCDMVADARAATPSEAAERLVQDSTARGREFHTLRRRLLRATRERLREDRALLDGWRARLGDPRYLLAERQQTLDDLRFRLERRTKQILSRMSFRLGFTQKRLAERHPHLTVERARARVTPLELRLRHAMRGRLVRLRERLDGQRGRLQDLSPLRVLARGYAIAIDSQGRAVNDAASLGVHDHLEVRLHRGSVRAEVLEVKPARDAEGELAS